MASKKLPGLYADGGGLYLQLAPSGDKISKAWIFRFRSPVSKTDRYMGLGPLHAVTLPAARDKATAQRGLLSQGIDPIAARDKELQRKAADAARAVTFAQCAKLYIESHKAGWRNAKHADQWTNTIEAYANPVIGTLPVQDVDNELILKFLEPIWTSKPETASRVRGRVEAVLDWAKARGYRTGENPARWRGHLDMLLPRLSKKGRVKHHTAMPFSGVPAFVSRLRTIPGAAARCLEFVILTIARTSEATNAMPAEIDIANATWTIPASRMKAKVEHRVPLSPRALEIAKEMLAQDAGCLFPGPRTGKPLSNMAMLQLLDRMEVDVTTHGFRSSFRDWAAERTSFPHEVCEMALAHTINNQAEAAYRRGDLFEKRRKLMDAWANYVNTPAEDGAVIPLRQAA